jgi:protein tyrosine/serine phosphatase
MRIFYRTAAIALVMAAVTAAMTMRSFLLDNNRHVVLERRVYRGAQPSASRLARDIERLGLRSVINVHEGDRTIPLFARQRELCAERGVQCIGVDLPEDSLPSRGQLLQLIRALDQAQQPVLIHGRYGIARAGLAAAVAQLLAGQEPSAAHKEFSWRHGCLDCTPHSNERVITDYENWLARQNRQHSPATFRHWAQRHYEKARLLLP